VLAEHSLKATAALIEFTLINKMLSMTTGSEKKSNSMPWKRSVFAVEHNGTVNMFIVEFCSFYPVKDIQSY
jgi:hypothetical protein